MGGPRATEDDGHETTKRKKAAPRGFNPWAPSFDPEVCPGCHRGVHAHCLMAVDATLSCNCGVCYGQGNPFE